MSGRVVHFELPYRDPEVLSEFYVKLFDWRLWPVPELNYIGLSTGPMTEQGNPSGKGYIGGALRPARDTESKPVVMIDVADIDATLDDVVAAGGSIKLAKAAVGEHGWCAYFADPEGNILGLWQSRELG